MNTNTQEYDLTYQQMRRYFCTAERHGQHLTGYIVISQDSFDKPYSFESRTYELTSDNKAFRSKTGGRSIFASSLDGTDRGVRLDWYLAEIGNKDGWKIERCYMLPQDMERAKAIMQKERAKER